ncbi:conjugal transfer nickase/helicase TraI [Klebsiella pneumoniae]|uniref:MobF family relaxase n=1 Tax=Klebsiella pneumoniae TaxID=573 RepID=UPI000E2C5D9D|nr:MobF family relaxase [Klebsiella pneumoniae]SXN82069.1 conjugal transfer nickase/helicase TraI [Klebsiella pneumoniae]
MLSVSTVKSASKASVYYFEEDNYYFQGEKSTAWYGAGAESLGLEGPVKQEMFKQVLEGKLPDGSDLTHMVGNENKHRPGYDLTFSAPKSASILALVYGDKTVLDAHKWAVERTLDEVEKLASTRTYSGGETTFEQTGNLVIAQFLHDTNRNSEPHMHTHTVVANVTMNGSGWKTLSSDTKSGKGFTDTVWNHQVAIGSIYRRFYKGKLEAEGYPIEEKGPRGEWDIAGVPIDDLSTRRQEIIEKVGEDASAKAKSVAALDTRKTKDFTDIENVRKGWRETMEKAGFDYEQFETERQERVPGTSQVPTLTAGSDPQKGNAPADPHRVNITPQNVPGVVHPGADRSEPQPVLEKQAKENPLSAIVDKAIEQVSSKNVRFTYDNVLTNVLNQTEIKKGVYQEARQALDAAVEKGSLIAVDTKQTLFTSAMHVRDEQRLSQIAGRMAEQSAGLTADVNARDITAKIADRDRALTLVDARGGGEFQSNLLSRMKELAQNSSKTPVLIAGNVKDKNQYSEHHSVMAITVKELATTELPENTMLIIPEAEKLNVPAMYEVLKTANAVNAPTVVIDTHTRRATGFASEVLRGAGAPVLSSSPGMEKSSLTLVQKDTVDDRLQVAARYVSQQKAAGIHVVAQAGNDRTRGQLTREIRNALQENGILGETVATISTLSPVWLDGTNRNLRSTYQTGMVLERYEGKELQETMTITGISDNHNTLRVVNEHGESQGLRLNAIDSQYRLYKQRELEIREGEQLKATGASSQMNAGDNFRVSGVRNGNWLFREKLVLETANGKTIKVRMDQPLKLDYGYTEGLGASRNSDGHVVAVLSSKEVTDTTVNQLRRSGENIIAFTPLDEASITARLEYERTSVSVTQGIKNLSGNDDITLALRELQNNRLAPRERAVRQAIELVQGTNVTFSSLNVVSTALKMDQSLSPLVAQAELLRLENRGEIIALDGNQGRFGDYVQRENWQNEKTILKNILEGKNAVDPLIADARHETEGKGLTDGQQNAAGLILESRDRFVTVQGYAGVGKTTQYRVVAAAVNQVEGLEIRGLAPTHRAVGELQAAGIPAQTIASFLSEQGERQANGQTTDYSRTLFVIDESSMIGNRDLATLTDIIVAGNGRAVMSGDEAQLKPLESGVPFSLTLNRSAADVAIMKEIVRQTPELRPAVEHIIAGQVQEALNVADMVSPSIVPRDKDATVPERSIIDLKDSDKIAVDEIATDFAGRTSEARDKTLIVAELNRDRMAINESVHDLLQAKGELGDSVTVNHLVRVSNSMADLNRPGFWSENYKNTVRIGEQYLTIGLVDPKSNLVELNHQETGSSRWISPLELRASNVAVFETKEMEVSVGERIRFTATDHDRKVKSNDLAVVTEIDKVGKITLDAGGRKVVLDPREQKDQHFDYGYAVTTYSSQGASVPYIIGLVGVDGARERMASLDSTYVQLSRSVEHIQLYADDLNKWVEKVKERSGERETVHDVMLRGEDLKATNELNIWKRSQPVSATRLAAKIEDGTADAAHFRSGKTPELLYAVLNEHGRQRGNWHVPVSPTTGRLDVENAYYAGASDGVMVVMQQGESEGKPIYTDNLPQALSEMAEHPDKAVIILRDSDRNETTDVSAAETIDIKLEDEIEKEKIKELLKIDTEEPLKGDELKDKIESERDTKELNDEKLIEQINREINEEENKERQENYHVELMNDELNIVRHDKEKDYQPDYQPEIIREVQKTIE